MNLLVLGCGKTGSLVAETARQRGHQLQVVRAAENPNAAALTPEALDQIDVAIDFTTPHAVLENIAACARAGTKMVVGTTGWYSELDRVRELVEERGLGFIYGSNFSVGVNLFFDIIRASAAAVELGYSGQIFERHHAQKKDAPSGTAVSIQKIVREISGKELEITSFREGDVVGMHELILDSAADEIYLCHDSKSRRGFAEGAVRAAEWLQGQTGFYDFKDIWRRLSP